MTVKTLTVEELAAMLSRRLHATMNRWLERGDGVAVYRNALIGDPNFGHRQAVSFGSAEAQLEIDNPPLRLPDIGNRINWRYQLEGVYRGAPIPAELSVIHPADVIERRYMDLELFRLACKAANARAFLHLVDPRMEGSDYEVELDADLDFFVEEDVEETEEEADIPNGLILRVSRHTPYGTEVFGGWLPVVKREDGDRFHGPGKPNGLARFLVRIDEHALDADLWNGPKEPEIRSFTEDGMDYVSVDGDTIPADEYDESEHYSKPDDGFVYEELAHVLRQVLEIGPRRVFDRDATDKARAEDPQAAPVWRILDGADEPLGDN